MATTKRDVKRPEAKLVPGYPQCGTCAYALVHGLAEDGSPFLKCHGHGPKLYTQFMPPAGFDVRVDYPRVLLDFPGCEKHPLWPDELRKPFLGATKRPRPTPPKE
jgi:hypothetical protein